MSGSIISTWITLWLTTLTRRVVISCLSRTDGTEILQRTTKRSASSSIRRDSTKSRRRGSLFKSFDFIGFRVEKYERDLKRWEFMDDEGKREAEKMQALQQKASTGRANKGAAFNILNLQYDESEQGYLLR